MRGAFAALLFLLVGCDAQQGAAARDSSKPAKQTDTTKQTSTAPSEDDDDKKDDDDSQDDDDDSQKTKTKTSTSTNVEDGDDDDDAESPDDDDSTNTQTATEDAAAAAAKAACLGKIAGYNPADVKCAIALSADSFWTSVGISAEMVDQQSAWLGPVPTGTFDGHPACPGTAETGTLIYVSNFDVPADGAYTVEAMTDFTGLVRLWKDGNPAKDYFAQADGTHGTHLVQNVTLEKGRYTVVIANPNNTTACAIAFSAAQGANVIKRSAGDDSWCVFRGGNEDLGTYVPGVAACRKCYLGE